MAQRLLFGTQGTSSSQSKYLVEFRAGKCIQKGKLVTPDKRKGLVYIQQTEDSLIHFCWKDRSSGATEDDLIMFPGDAEFEKVLQCTTGRVFVLKFKSNNKRCFYWMQEPKDDKDEEYKTKVNQFLNDPTAQARGSANTANIFGGSLTELTDDHDLNSLISGMSQRDLMQLFGGLGSNASNLTALLGNHAAARGGANRSSARQEDPMDTDVGAAPASGVVSGGGTGSGVAPPAASTPSSGKGAGIKPRNLAEILHKVNAEAAAVGSSSAKVDSISGVLTSPEILEPLINNPELMARVKQFLPPTSTAVESSVGTTAATTDSKPDLASEIKLTVKSPQFQQAVILFSEALASGQMGPVMNEFGMSDDIAAAAATGNMDEFVKALEKANKKDTLKGGASSPEDTEMNE